jgi:hypothetical protein
VLYTDVVVPEASRFLLCSDDHFFRFLREPLERALARTGAVPEQSRRPVVTALVGGLSCDPQAISDLGPRGPSLPRLVDAAGLVIALFAAVATDLALLIPPVLLLAFAGVALVPPRGRDPGDQRLDRSCSDHCSRSRSRCRT